MSSIYAVLWASSAPEELTDHVPACLGVFYEYEDALKCVRDEINENAEDQVTLEFLADAPKLEEDTWDTEIGILSIARTDFYA